ncbi:MAG: hypothetical protein L0226_15530 [Acidobacteria bacterium]|nr:hypothetical protein [Acidobacteriota bacterium]
MILSEMWIGRIKIVLVLGSVILFSVLLNPFSAQGQQTPTGQQPKQPINYEKFTHKSHLGTINVPGTNHYRPLNCNNCHERPSSTDLIKGIVQTTDRNKQFILKFPGHKACVECHVTQFTALPQQTCSICHQTKQGQNSGLPARPPQRDFPQRFDFNIFFDAKQHELHVTYNLPNSGQKLDCNFCHKQDARPAILTIPSHPECYVCHSPASGQPKASQKTDCKNCHTETVTNVQVFSTKYISRAYGAQFTHKEHVNFMNGKCDMCHTISGGYNQPTPTSVRIKQHLNPGERSGRGCFSCHDGGVHYGRKVFSGEPGTEGGGSCKKCHLRADFKIIPSSG